MKGLGIRKAVNSQQLSTETEQLLQDVRKAFQSRTQRQPNSQSVERSRHVQAHVVLETLPPTHPSRGIYGRMCSPRDGGNGGPTRREGVAEGGQLGPRQEKTGLREVSLEEGGRAGHLLACWRGVLRFSCQVWEKK